ncbi:DUF3253 domain-containing protein [Cognatilysobacter terrigena]|uniref:DUF3253 domain-containing protein n=1 Tax=Cognatilysobacter terrigena TaxID=2488749 RepID=UPI0010601BC4|nr:DUF3253 domain-containing protein [Lysobacter terrigena]
MVGDATIRERIVALLASRAPTSSICPSDVARSLSDDEAEWRALMPRVRHVAAMLSETRVVTVTQGEGVLPSAGVLTASGPIRLRRGAMFPVDR